MTSKVLPIFLMVLMPLLPVMADTLYEPSLDQNAFSPEENLLEKGAGSTINHTYGHTAFSDNRHKGEASVNLTKDQTPAEKAALRMHVGDNDYARIQMMGTLSENGIDAAIKDALVIQLAFRWDSVVEKYATVRVLGPKNEGRDALLQIDLREVPKLIDLGGKTSVELKGISEKRTKIQPDTWYILKIELPEAGRSEEALTTVNLYDTDQTLLASAQDKLLRQPVDGYGRLSIDLANGSKEGEHIPRTILFGDIIVKTKN